MRLFQNAAAGGENKMSDELYLIWSNEYGKWWRPRHCGYTALIEEAGRYTLEEARQLTEVTCDGKLFGTRTDPVTGEKYKSSEIIVPEPVETKP